MKKRWIGVCIAALILSLVCGISASAAGGIEITEQPQDIAAAIGSTGTATVTADGAVAYKWYFKSVGSSAWQASGMKGYNTPTISVPVTQARLGQQYKCVLTDAEGQTVETDVVTVVNPQASEITVVSQPMDIKSAIGTTGTATVEAVSDAALSYRWYFKSVSRDYWQASGMTGYDTPTISVPVTKARIGQQYKCVITTADGGRIETDVVTILQPEPSVITIDEQPEDMYAAVGESATATVSASTESGATLSYQWYFMSKNGTAWQVSGMPGCKTDTISVPVTTARIGQQYKCVITTADGGRIETEPATILQPEPSVITVDEQPEDMYAAIGGNATATVSASTESGAALSYQWYFKSVSRDYWQASGMTGAKTATITVPVTTARIGQQYKCVITTADGGRIETEPVTIMEKPDITLTITHDPDSYRTYCGEPVELEITVGIDTNTYPVKYQWYKDGVKLEGATDRILYYPSVDADAAGTYYCVVSGYGMRVQSGSGIVEILG